MNIERASFRLGEWIIDPMSGAFQKGDHTVHAEPKVMDVLVCLATRPGQVVSRDELFQQVWGNVVVSEEVLTRCVSELRTLLGDTNRERRYIKTVPKRGYALIMPVSPLVEIDESESIDNSTDTVSAKNPAPTALVERSRRYQQMPMTAFFIMLSITLGWFLYQHFYSSPMAQEALSTGAGALRSAGMAALSQPLTNKPPGRMESVAVLPFVHMHDAPEYTYFSKGLAEDIRNALMTHYNLRVAARTSSEAFSTQAMDIREIGQQLRVDVIVEGSVRIIEDQVRITVRLTNTEDGYLVWANSFDRTLDNMLVVQSEIAEEIAKQLLPTFREVARAPKEEKEEDVVIHVDLPARPSCAEGCHEPPPENAQFTLNAPQNSQAYEAYVMGRHHWHKRTVESFAQSVKSFEESLRHDENFAPAYSGLADAYILNAIYNPDAELQEVLPKAIAHARKALRLSPLLAEAYASLGIIYEVQNESRKARQFYEHAVRLKPHYSMARMWLGNTFLDLGDVNQAYEQYKVALDVDPLHPVIQQNYLNALANMGQYKRALTLAKNYYQISNSDRFLKVQLNVLYNSGQYDEALALVEQYSDENLDRHFTMYVINVLWHLERFEEGGSLLDEIKGDIEKAEYLLIEIERALVQRDADKLLELADAFEILSKEELMNSEAKRLQKPECLTASANYWRALAAYIKKDFAGAITWFEIIQTADKLIQAEQDTQVLNCFNEPSKKGEFFAYYADALMQHGDRQAKATEIQSQGLALISEARQQGWNTADLWIAEAGLRMVTGDYQAAKFMFAEMEENLWQPYSLINAKPLFDRLPDSKKALGKGVVTDDSVVAIWPRADEVD